jgi:hypothetical protein
MIRQWWRRMLVRFGVTPRPAPCPHQFPFAVVRIRRTSDSDTSQIITLAYGDEMTLTYELGQVDIVHHYREDELRP